MVSPAERYRAPAERYLFADGLTFDSDLCSVTSHSDPMASKRVNHVTPEDEVATLGRVCSESQEREEGAEKGLEHDVLWVPVSWGGRCQCPQHEN